MINQECPTAADYEECEKKLLQKLEEALKECGPSHCEWRADYAYIAELEECFANGYTEAYCKA